MRRRVLMRQTTRTPDAFAHAQHACTLEQKLFRMRHCEAGNDRSSEKRKQGVRKHRKSLFFKTLIFRTLIFGTKRSFE
jgi:hypothetical protein